MYEVELVPVSTIDPVMEQSSDLAPGHPRPVRWTPALRVLFRFVFCYTLLYAACCDNATIWELIPWIGPKFADWLAWPFQQMALVLGHRWFHLSGVGAQFHPTGSGDTALQWIVLLVMLATAALAALVWSVLDRRRMAYPTLVAWMRFLLRLTLVVAMTGYGLAKLFPLQMAPPSLAVLNEPLGNTSPMTLLWTMLGLNPVYQMICGGAEVAAGLLLAFRRTALAGALLTGFVMTNVLLYNLFFDVPVKIYAAHLVLFAVVIIAPDIGALVGFFWRHVPSAPAGTWVPPARRKSFRVATLVVELVVFASILLSVPQYWKGYAAMRASLRHPQPLTGEWKVDSAVGPDGSPKPYLTGDGAPMEAIFLEPSGRTMLRDSAGVLWRAGVKVNPTKHTLRLVGEVEAPVVFIMSQPNPATLVLTPQDKKAAVGVLHLTRVPLPTSYPLEQRGLHWVNEWGLER